LLNVEVKRFGRRRRLSLWLGGIAGDKAEALDASAQTVAPKDLEHTAR